MVYKLNLKKMGYWGEWSLWIIAIVIIILKSGIETNGCWDQERDALLQLNASAPISYYNMWVNVKTSNCCEWDGVTCGKNTRITSLSLDYFFHSESEEGWHVNASIFLPFQQLHVLDLSSNNIVSWTEDKGCMKLSSKLSNLQELYLGNNMLDNTIWSQLSEFQSLKSLHLSGNRLDGAIPLHGCMKLSSKLSNLQELYLRGNMLNNTIWVQLSEFQLLKTLDLSGNQLDGAIPLHGCNEPKHRFQNPHLYGNTSCFSGLLSLRLLDLSSNKLAGEIPLWLQNMTSLEKLYISGNHLTGNIASSPLIHLLSLNDLDLADNHLQIPDSFISNHTKLKSFVGDFNQVVHDVSKSNIQPSTMGLQLQLLSLSNCALSTYPSFLHHQRDLRFIDLSDNVLHGGFPTWLLENNLRLKSLILSNNSLTGSLQLPSLKHPYLMQLRIAQNKIQGHIPYNIGVVFPKLSELDLSNNRFMGCIPSSLGDLKFLEKLYLSNNHLSGGIEHLNKSCINLEELDLSYNDFEGDLPSFEGLKSLEDLNLQGNNYSGRLRKNMFGPNLVTIDLSNNSLEGPIPNYICNNNSFPLLELLDLSFNKLNGSLPNCSIGAISIYLNDNRLSGHLTDAFLNHSFGSLQFLDLSNNGLSGPIPTAIGNLTFLYALLLRGNQFHGPFPNQLCRLTILSVLDLSSNSLHGPIPTCLGRIMVYNEDLIIGYANIFDNKVKFVTKYMVYSYTGSALTNMSGINLSSNNLTGHIPHELGNLSNIHVLNLSHNNLWGGIPTTFSDLENIESLDLSYNHLNGSIPTTLTKLNTLEVFKVSYNNLSGRIPYEVQFDTFDASSYEGNPFLCGPPLSKSCTTGDESPSISGNASKDEVEDHDWIDTETFYVTFVVSAVTMFLAVVIIMLINPHWSNVLFYLVKTCITSSYYFVEDIMQKLRRVRHV